MPPLMQQRTRVETIDNMDSPHYPLPSGVHAIPREMLDLRPDSEVDQDLLHPPAVSSEKNIWFYWHQGYAQMHGYTQRSVRAWHRRFSRQGWTVRVLDRVADSPLNVSRFLDVSDPGTFPKAFITGAIGGDYAPQHNSDLVRFPLLLRYGGVYADVGLMQIGDLTALWDRTVGDSASPWEVVSYNCGGPDERSLANYFLAARPQSPFFDRCHRLLLALWNLDGGRTHTTGLHASPLLAGVPMMGEGLTWEENGRTIPPDEGSRILTDYIIQGRAMSAVMGLVDHETGWDGPRFCADHIYAIDYMDGSQLVNDLTDWSGPRAFELLSLPMPGDGEAETADQAKAREIVEECLRRSFAFKLAHGLIVRAHGHTLGSLWRKHTGSDHVPGTYAHWLRQGMIYWCPDEPPQRQDWQVIEPFRTGPLLRAD